MAADTQIQPETLWRSLRANWERSLPGRCAPFFLLIAAYGIIMLQGTSRMYWPYMLATYALAAAIYVLYESRQPDARAASLREYLFPTDVWLHKSAREDGIIFLVNYWIFITGINAAILSPSVVTELSQIISGLFYHLFHALSLPRQTAAPGLGVTLLYTFCTMMLGELFYYGWHRLCHETPLLWHFHKVHHSAEVMTPLTYIRGHPLDMLVQTLWRVLALAIPGGVFYYFYPNMKGLVRIAEVDVFLAACYILGGNLHHSHVWFSWGPKLERLIFSPAQHQIHHSNDPKHFNHNYGSMVSFWDWIFGTLYTIKTREQITFGLTASDKKHFKNIWDMYAFPVKNLLRKLR